MRTRIALWAVIIALPLLGFGILLWQPALDIMWEHHPAYFWLVLGVVLVTGILAIMIGEAARGELESISLHQQ